MANSHSSESAPPRPWGGRGQSPTLLFHPGTQTPHPPMGPAVALFAEFLLPGNVGMGRHLPGVCVLQCGHGRGTPGEDSRVHGLAVLVAREGFSPWLSWFVTSQGWFGARFGPKKPPFKWGLPAWGQSLCGAPEGTFGLARPFGASQCPLSSPGTAQLGSEAAMG